MIEIKGSNARPADWCLTHYTVTIPPKMFIPGVGTWVKQRNPVAGIRVNDFDAVGLAQVATRTGPGEIVRLKMSAARLGDHMLDMEGAPCSDWCIRQYSQRPAALASTCRWIALWDITVVCARASAALGLAPTRAAR
jgi:hypothetical protein